MSNKIATSDVQYAYPYEPECVTRMRKEMSRLARRQPHRSQTEDGTIGWDDLVRAFEDCQSQQGE